MRIAAVWVWAAAITAWFVATTSIGPVVYSIGWRHGVHATDVAVGLALASAAAWITSREVNGTPLRTIVSDGRVSRGGPNDEQLVNGASDA
jgi:hypothetical protein